MRLYRLQMTVFIIRLSTEWLTGCTKRNLVSLELLNGTRMDPKSHTLKFDEREVPEFTMTNYKNGLYPEYQTFKYPKVGEKNSVVTVHVYDDIKSNSTFDVNLDPSIEYIPRLKWSEKPRELVVFTMNRLQNYLGALAY